jgi:hypothetical protein
MTKLITEWENSKYLCLSSLLFLLPAIYSYYIEFYYYTIGQCIMCFISINYWRKPQYDYRRYIDMFYATLCIIYAIYLTSYVMHNIILLGLWLSVVYNYYLSNKYYYNHNNIWLKYHIMFHISCMFLQLYLFILHHKLRK